MVDVNKPGKAIEEKSSQLDLSVIATDQQLERDIIDIEARIDALDSEDLIAEDSIDTFCKHWRKLYKRLQDLNKSHSDGRLELWLYRAELATCGIQVAFSRMQSWYDWLLVVQQHGMQAALPEEMLTQWIYLFSDAHLSHLRKATLDVGVAWEVSALFKKTERPDVVKKKNPQSQVDLAVEEQQGIQERSQWLRKQSKFIFLIDQSISTLRALYIWINENNSLGYAMKSDRLFAFLGLLREAAVDRGAPLPINPNTGMKVAEPPDKTTGLYPSSNEATVVHDMDRQAVGQTIAELCVWFERNDPASPAPYFLQRALRLMDANFHSILKDLIPDAVEKFEHLAGMEGGK